MSARTSDEKVIPERYCSGCHPYGWPNGPMPHEPWCTAAPVIRPSKPKVEVTDADRDRAQSFNRFMYIKLSRYELEQLAVEFAHHCHSPETSEWQCTHCGCSNASTVTVNVTHCKQCEWSRHSMSGGVAHARNCGIFVCDPCDCSAHTQKASE